MAVAAIAAARQGRADPPTALGVEVAIADPSGAALARWQAALAEVDSGDRIARAAVWGASHTAADLWTGELRRRLQARHGDAGHGFVLPARWNIGYRHQDIGTEASPGWAAVRHLRADGDAAVGDFGLAGVRMDSADPAQFAVVRTAASGPGASWSRFELWWKSAAGAGDLMVEVDGAEAHTVTTRGPAGPGRQIWQLAPGAHAVRFRPAGNGPVAVYGAVAERGARGVVVDQLGIPGMQAGIVLHWQASPWAQQVGWRRPDLVVLAYGTNDASDPTQDAKAYAQTWRKVLERTRAAAPQASCVIVGPTDRLVRSGGKRGPWQPVARTADVIEVQRRAAADHGCGHWDAQAAMGGPGAMAAWVDAGLAVHDRTHLTRAGYARLAELFDRALHGASAKAGGGQRASPRRR